MNTISIRKDSPAGKAIIAAADYTGISAADLLAGICINATRRAKLTQTSATPSPTQPELPLPQPPAPKAAPTAGMFDLT